ncbi:MAG: hypothetical protein NTW95_07140 [Candidatus Aminicenantes bacterium]|nr:hypothetical protein [Candidatus Aminicenantes bacterium]
MENDDIKKTLQELKVLCDAERERLEGIDTLAGGPVDREIAIDFWKLSNAEIEREMWNRLALLDEDADCLPAGPIASHRPILGKPIVFLKRMMRALTRPYTSLLLQKQNRLNRELVTFQLLTFLKLRHQEKMIRETAERAADFPDPQPAGADNGKKTTRKT